MPIIKKIFNELKRQWKDIQESLTKLGNYGAKNIFVDFFSILSFALKKLLHQKIKRELLEVGVNDIYRWISLIAFYHHRMHILEFQWSIEALSNLNSTVSITSRVARSNIRQWIIFIFFLARSFIYWHSFYQFVCLHERTSIIKMGKNIQLKSHTSSWLANNIRMESSGGGTPKNINKRFF